MIARILAIRTELGTKPVWKAARLRGILADPVLRARPWPEVCAKALAMAADPETKYPTRLTAEGYWLASGAVPAPPSRRAEHGPWCGQCDRRSRQRERPGDGRPIKCPECHRDNVRRAAS